MSIPLTMHAQLTIRQYLIIVTCKSDIWWILHEVNPKIYIGEKRLNKHEEVCKSSFRYLRHRWIYFINSNIVE